MSVKQGEAEQPSQVEVRLLPSSSLPRRLRLPSGSPPLRVPVALGRAAMSKLVNHLLFGTMTSSTGLDHQDDDGDDDDDFSEAAMFRSAQKKRGGADSSAVDDAADSAAAGSVVFDFAISGKLLRSSLGEFLEESGELQLSAEVVIDVVYFEATAPPTPSGFLESDQWITALDAWRSARGTCVSGEYDGCVRLWDLSCASSTNEDGSASSVDPEDAVIAECRGGHDAAVKAVVVLGKTDTADGKTVTVLSASQDSTLRVWSIPLREQKAGGASRKRSAKGKASAVARGDSTLVCVGHEGTVECASLCPVRESSVGLQRFCSGGWDSKVHIWSATPSQDQASQETDGGDGEGSSTKKRRTETPVARPLATLAEHTQPVRAVCWTQPTQIITASYDQTVRVWDASTQACVHTMHGPSPALTMSHCPGSQLILTGHTDGGVRLWDPRVRNSAAASQQVSGRSLAPARTANTGIAGNTFVTSVAWQPNSETVYMAGSQGGLVKIMDVRSAVALHTLAMKKERVMCVDWAAGTTSSSIRAVSGGADKKISLWDVKQPSLHH